MWCLLRDLLRKILHSNGWIHRSPIILHLRYLALHTLINFISRSESYVLKGEVVMCALCITVLMVSIAIENTLNSFMSFLLLFACRLSFWWCPFSRMCGFIFAFSFLGFLIFTTLDSFYFLGNLSELVIFFQLSQLLSFQEVIWPFFLTRLLLFFLWRAILSTFSKCLITCWLSKLIVLIWVSESCLTWSRAILIVICVVNIEINKWLFTSLT